MSSTTNFNKLWRGLKDSAKETFRVTFKDIMGFFKTPAPYSLAIGKVLKIEPGKFWKLVNFDEKERIYTFEDYSFKKYVFTYDEFINLLNSKKNYWMWSYNSRRTTYR